MTRVEAITADCLFLLTLGDGKGFREIWLEDRCYWTAPADRRDFHRKLQAIRVLGDGSVSAVPRLDRDRYFTTPSSCLWVRCETRHAAELLAAFEPRPTLILRDGETVKRSAFWLLDSPLDALWALRANERLAQALTGIRKHAALNALIVPPEARTGAQTVHVEELRLASYHPNQVVGSARPGGKLKDAPDLEALRAKHRRKQEALAA